MKRFLPLIFGLFLCLLGGQSYADNFFNDIYKASSIGVNAPHHPRIGSSSSSSSCSLSVTISPLSETICSGTSVTLTAVVTDNSSSTFSYTWTSPTLSTYDTTNVDPLTSTSYTVTVTDGIGCSSIASATITVNSSPTVTVSPQTICSGNEATLTATVTDPSSTLFNYTWTTGGTNDTIDVNPTSSSTYTVTVSDGNSCSGTAIGSVTVTSSPTVTVSPQTICSGNMATLTATVAPFSSSYTYSWTTGGTNDTIDVSPGTNGTYTVIVSDGGSCTATATGAVTVNSTPTVTISPQTLCFGSGNIATLMATVTDPSSTTYSYNWNTGGTLDTIDVNPTTSGTYTVTVVDGNSCSATAVGNVTVYASPVITIVNPSPDCIGTIITLTANVTDASSNTFRYSWNTTGTNDTIDVSPPGNMMYTVVVIDGNNCVSSDSTLVQINPLPIVTFTTINFSDTLCQTSTPYPISGGSPTGGSYSGPNVLSGSFIPNTSGVFRILYTFTDSLGCSDTASHQVVVEACTGTGNITTTTDYEIYPNPAINILNIKFGSSSQGQQVSVCLTDVSGRILAESVKQYKTI